MEYLNKKKILKKHKLFATSLLLLMAVIYIGMIYLLNTHPQKWMEYVKAFTEAGMVGALADWFAVTALFRYPLNLKIPHTNLINNNKDALGKNLGDFVSNNFLTSKNIKPYISSFTLSSYLNAWLTNPKNVQIINNEILKITENIITNLNDEQIVRFLSKKGSEVTEDIKVEKLAATALLYLLEQKEHDRLLNVILPQAQSYVENNRELIYKKVVEKQPILGLIGGKSVTNQLISGITTFLQEIENNQEHDIRKNITIKMYEIVQELNESEKWQDKFNQIKHEFLTQEKINQYANDVWLKLKNELLLNLHSTESSVANYIQLNIKNIIDNFINDTETHKKIDAFSRQYLYKIVLKNSNQVGTIITNTVHNWDGKELSEKLELEVGKDLQYIRINGTLVGGFVGLIIYIITHLFI